MAARLGSASPLPGYYTGPFCWNNRDVRVHIMEGRNVLMTKMLEEGQKHGRSICPKAYLKVYSGSRVAAGLGNSHKYSKDLGQRLITKVHV